MKSRDSNLPIRHKDRVSKRASAPEPDPALDWLSELGPLKTGTIGGCNWAFRQRPRWEANFVAAWMPRANTRDMAQFFQKTRAVEDMGGTGPVANDATLHSLSRNNMATTYIPAFKVALQLTFSVPDQAIIVEEDWNVLDFMFLDDATWWRLLWYTTA